MKYIKLTFVYFNVFWINTFPLLANKWHDKQINKRKVRNIIIIITVETIKFFIHI